MMKRGEFDYDFKLLLLGDSAVGKTCITIRIGGDRFEENHVLTIGKVGYWTLEFGVVVVGAVCIGFDYCLDTSWQLAPCSGYWKQRPSCREQQ